MMDIFAGLGHGFSIAATPLNLLFCLVGAVCGTLIGVLPGLGPVATISLLLPATYALDPIGAIIMLAGIYYGAQYGGSTTAILVNIPGESTSVVTAIDGYKMAQQGRAGEALAIAAIGSFIAGCFGTVVIALLGPPLALMTQKFASPDYFSLMVLGLVSAVVLANGSAFRAVAMIFLGLLLGMVGMDINTGEARMTFGLIELSDGINFVALVMGLFGVAEVISNLENVSTRIVNHSKINSIWPSFKVLRGAWGAVTRGTLLGTLFGILPGGGATIASFSSYALEKRVSKTPERFGNGAIEGVAGPESANNAAAQTSFVPLLTMGIPTSATMALLVGALTLHGIAPGPTIISRQPDLFWGLIASMFLGNAMLVIINLPMIGIWVRLLNVPYRILYLVILVVCAIGVFSVNNSSFDIYMTVGFTALGYILRKLDAEPAPLLMGFVLGPMVEENFRRSLITSHGDPMVFLQRPISLTLLLLSAALLISIVMPSISKRRGEVFQE
ncbi:tripartite tricarboxylate transporter permease [Tardiphaga sp. 866_E4_N2_1]|jgi:putative tricarboxylic transport membrane protein|uniref:tripartite tricarboxylate transporter permease n=1 Tax=Nitrobacteraceae TaxID=41294 RepID=UPI0008A722C0|nr:MULTISPECIES: tripartite tricarboxylate transporter permease [Nitrobacteraceae]SEH81215.1 putative tricarboxylic transport membrane protein [Tardiphaga sp. OK245]SFL39671.1 putative tricarboxylic transport membrane protein [Bradyrhizobium sp. NFR13]